MRIRQFISALAAVAALAVMPAGVPAFADEQEELFPEPAPIVLEEPAIDPTALNDEFAPGDKASGTGVPDSNPPAVGWEEPDVVTSRAASPSEIKSGTANRAPVGTIPAAPGLGALPYMAFDQTALTTDTVARTNLGNGNLLLTASDGVLNGPGLTLRNDRYYNGLSDKAGSFGAGWSSPLSAVDFGLTFSGYNVKFTGPTGLTATFVLTGSTYVAPAGFNARLVKTGTDYFLTYNQTGETLRFNSSGWITTDKNRNGVGTTYTYGTGNKVSQVTEASGRYFQIFWDTNGYIDYIIDSSGRRTDYTQNASGQLTRLVKPGGYYEEYDYDAVGRISQLRWDATTSGQTGKVDFTYDTSQRVTGIKQGNLTAPTYITTKTYVYTAGQTVFTDGNGDATTFAIDSSGRMTSYTDANGNGQSQHWTGYNVDQSTNGIGTGSTGYQTVNTYDSLNNQITTKLPTGATASAQYALGTGCAGSGGDGYQLRCSADASGNTKQNDYDSAGNLLQTTDTSATASGGTGAITQRYTYATGNAGCWGVGGYPGNGFNGQVCSSKDGNGNLTKYEYDAAGNLSKVTPPTPMGPTTYTYDSLGRVLSVRDGNNDTTAYTHNVRDEILTTTFDSGDVLNTTYYPNGIEFKNEENTGLVGPVTLNYYNEVGWLRQQDAINEMNGPTRRFEYTYDLAGNTRSYEDNSYGLITYGYDHAHNVTSVIEPSGSCNAGDTAPVASSGCVKIRYDSSNHEKLRMFPGGGRVDTSHDNSGRITQVLAKDGSSASKVDIGYSYTAGANDRTVIQKRTSTLEEGVIPGAATSYTYDGLNRLKTAIEKNGATTTASWAYSYDNAGNRTQQIQSGTAPNPGTINYTYGANNQITGSSADTASVAWDYDAAGNQKKQAIRNLAATYNDRGAVSTFGTASYTAWQQGNGNTVKRVNGSSTSVFLNSPTGLMGDNIGTGQRAYTRTPDGGLISSRLGGGSRYYYVLDSLGSVVGLFAKDGTYYGGYSYGPYGEIRYKGTDQALDNNRLRYIGGYFDEPSSFYRFGARYYDPTIGRFTQFDPSGQESNPYAYAGCNPVNSRDPSGLAPTCEEGLVAGGAATIVGAEVALGALALGPLGGPIGIAVGGAVAAGAAVVSGLGALTVAATYLFIC